MRRKSWVLLSGLIFLSMLLFAPQVALTARFAGRTYDQANLVPTSDYGIVFGAYVNEDGSLSDAALERVEAAVRLYQQGRIHKLYISGDNRSNGQADVIAAYAQGRGVAAEDVVVDRLGIDTHDTCRHFAEVASQGILLTQQFHLPRAMYMCEHEGVAVRGVAVDRLEILAERGSSPAAIGFTRAVRFARECALTWLFLTGLYDKISNEAEGLEARGAPSSPHTPWYPTGSRVSYAALRMLHAAEALGNPVRPNGFTDREDVAFGSAAMGFHSTDRAAFAANNLAQHVKQFSSRLSVLPLP